MLSLHFITVPIMLCCGVSTYFICDKVNFSYFTLMLIVILAVGIYFLQRKIYLKYFSRTLNTERLAIVEKALTIFLLSVQAFCVGYAAAAYRTQSMIFPIVTEKIGPIDITGVIAKIEPREKDYRLYLSSLVIDGFDTDRTPAMIRLNTKEKNRYILRIGQKIRTKAEIMPPPLPTHSDGMDLAFLAYFKRIGGMGYTTGKIFVQHAEEMSGDTSQSFTDMMKMTVNKLRRHIAQRIKEDMKHKNHSVASAMLLGETSEIPEEDAEYLRIAGTAHLIAISGMHVTSVAGIVFFITLMIAKNTAIVGSHNISKIAAAIAIPFTLFYLVLSGAPVSAQRAVATSVIFFISIIVDRQYNPLRAICIVACMVIIITPEMLFSPGLQMSFAASGSLIAGFEFFSRFYNKYAASDDMKHDDKYYCLSSRLWRVAKNFILQIITLLFASITASVATAPFIAYHFNKISFYSIIANIFCVPVMEFFVMPCGLVSLFLMPIRMDWIGLVGMKYGIEVILQVSRLVSQISHATIQSPQISNYVIASLALLLYLVITVHNKKWKFGMLMAFILIFAVAVMRQNPMPLMIISGKVHGKSSLFVVRDDVICKGNADSKKRGAITKKVIKDEVREIAVPKLIVSSKQSERYAFATWKQHFGANNFASKSVLSLKLKTCTSRYCEICFCEGFYGVINYDSAAIVQILDREKNIILSITRDELIHNGTYTIYGKTIDGKCAFDVRHSGLRISERPWHAHLAR